MDGPFRSPQDVYATNLSSTRGYPLWFPESSVQQLSYHPEGLRIGDVGAINKHGIFELLFNVCLPEEDPFNKKAGVPPGFTPLALAEADIKTVRNAEVPGQLIKGSTITRVDADGVPITGDVLMGIKSGTSFKFNFSTADGALLILPDGAESHDLRDPRPLLEHVSRNAVAWYPFKSHDVVYVITGFHKALTWTEVAYQNECSDNYSAEFSVRPSENEPFSKRNEWFMGRNTDWRTGPHTDTGFVNQTVFLRGFKIALRSAMQDPSQQWTSFEPDPPSSFVGAAWKGLKRVLGVPGENDSTGTSGTQIVITRFPQILPVFHPADVINRYILRKEPSAKVAITHDSNWMSLLARNLLKQRDLTNIRLLTKAIGENYNIVVRGNVATLQSKSGADTFMVEPDEPDAGKYEREIGQPGCPGSLKVVSESNYRCIDAAAESQPAGLQSIPSKLGAPSSVDTGTSPGSVRTIKIIMLSDYVCAFCYICDQVLRHAIEACRDLPVRFDVESRPFVLLNPSMLPPDQVLWRNTYATKRFGKEKADIKLKAVAELSQKAGLTLADDNILTVTTQAHRLSAKAYKDGGQELQRKFNTLIYDACLSEKADLSDEAVLVDAAVNSGLMNKDEATTFLHSTEHLQCVEKTVEAARSNGINGVPFVIIDGKLAVNGLQPVECFIQIFRKLASLPTSCAAKIEVHNQTAVQQDVAQACRLRQ